ncbi:hypothetical protein LTR66_007393 [Elasticomyces elasticus]|nr:hypothetical protein LTR66_007393 [Elasticomyces elasticus]
MAPGSIPTTTITSYTYVPSSAPTTNPFLIDHTVSPVLNMQISGSPTPEPGWYKNLSRATWIQPLTSFLWIYVVISIIGLTLVWSLGAMRRATSETRQRNSRPAPRGQTLDHRSHNSGAEERRSTNSGVAIEMTPYPQHHLASGALPSPGESVVTVQMLSDDLEDGLMDAGANAAVLSPDLLRRLDEVRERFDELERVFRESWTR